MALTHASLQLTLTDYQSESRWLWVLNDAKGNFLADHEVKLDVETDGYKGFFDLPAHLNRLRPIRSEAVILDETGAWMGREVFGDDIRKALKEHANGPAAIVHVIVPPEAQALLFRPFELAHLDGKPLAESGVRFVYQTATAAGRTSDKPIGEQLRILAIFSLPDNQTPLNLRRERYHLKQLVERFAAESRAVHLRVIQYGATRDILKDALEEGEGWDIIHFSGHGKRGELLLEKENGDADLITAEDFAALLSRARNNLKLLLLSACWSGAATLQDARVALGLDKAVPNTAQPLVILELPSLGQKLSAALDCAVLAMRYPVGDQFAIDLVSGLYGRMLGKNQALPGALQLTLDDILTPGRRRPAPPLSSGTPILFGARAAGLTLKPPPRDYSTERFDRKLAAFKEKEPEHFVGRLMPMLRASQALAPLNAHRGVLFHGMAGAGKTYCALELAYRHEQEEFVFVWHKAPDEDKDIATALGDFLIDLESQLRLHDVALISHVDDPENFRRKTLVDLKALLEQRRILIVLDNVESLLTSTGGWRDDKWGWLIHALLEHNGTSRLVLTSRRVPASLESHPKLLRESIHALSFSESVLLARELPNLSTLFDSPSGLTLLTRILKVAQGHPKLLDLADKSAPDPRALDQYLASSERAADPDAALDTFFATNESSQDERAFTATLHAWTAGLTANLPSTARLLFQFLCRLEEDDCLSWIINVVWPNFLNLLAETVPGSAAALLEPGHGLDSSLDRLATLGLVEMRRPHATAELTEVSAAARTLYRIHPAVAEAGRNGAQKAVLDAADIELGDFWIAVYQQGMATVMQGGGALVVHAGLRRAPYLLRTEFWHSAAFVLEKVVQLDRSPTTLATVLPLLRRTAEATRDMPDGAQYVGVLANALLKAGRYEEAEQILRELIPRCERQQDYRSASASAGNLMNLLMQLGRNQEALVVSEQKEDFMHLAGLGPWTQLGDEGGRLQILNQMGRYQEVLDAVLELRSRMNVLPEKSDMEETTNIWNVRESLLGIGGEAAFRLEQWAMALSLNAEIVESKQQRGADAFEIAWQRFNNCGPLLGLRRLREARTVLEYCRTAFEQAHAVRELGGVFSALANLEYQEGNSAAAAGFEGVALRYKYRAGLPVDCAGSHNNLANCLERLQANADSVLAHRLADGIICFQTGSGGLRQTLNILATMALPDTPPAFDEVAEIVEEVEGVRFREMFARLPLTTPDGDAAIREVWRMVKEGQGEREA